MVKGRVLLLRRRTLVHTYRGLDCYPDDANFALHSLVSELGCARLWFIVSSPTQLTGCEQQG